MKLFSISRRRKVNYKSVSAHKEFENKLYQDFTTTEINQKWCIDFIYLFLKNGTKHYSCFIIDLYDRSIVTSITDKFITVDLVKRILQKAIIFQPNLELKNLLIYLD